MLTHPTWQITELGLAELVGADEQVDQNDFGGSVACTLGDGVRPNSGEFLAFLFVTGETGSGAVQTPAGRLLLFDADPAISAGDTSITLAERKTLVGQVEITASDWISDANGASAYIYAQPLPFHNLQTVYAAWFHEDATSLNDGAGDDETLHFNAWYRRDT
ncbi:MAG: hypothetical protein GWN87_33690 [Desulfuromonadales bacterium]|nr:hypothetical protein [Desulfuromonadales bacterium]